MRRPSDLHSLPACALAALCLLHLAGCSGTPDPASPLGRACTEAAAPDQALARPMDLAGVDQWLFDAAVRKAVNAERCRRGLAPLAADPALARAATLHSGDMAMNGFFDHVSPVPGRASLRDRYREVGAGFPRAAENIADISLFDFGGGHFYVRDRAACRFSLTPDGPDVPIRSYAGAAGSLVALWMESPGHRRNLLDPGLTRHGAGAAIRPNTDTCGDLLVAQDFGG